MSQGHADDTAPDRGGLDRHASAQPASGGLQGNGRAVGYVSQSRLHVGEATDRAGGTLLLPGGRLRGRSEVGDSGRIPRTDGLGPAPLSPAQQGIWAVSQAARNPALYNACRAVRLRGALDEAALRQSLDHLARRHASLRTRFWAGPPVTQLAAPDAIVHFRVADLTKVPSANRERQALAVARHEFSQPFDLAAGPPLRATLVRLSPHDHMLVLVIHHIVIDAWSFGIIGRELGALYDAGGHARAAGLPELALQYGDYARWLAGQPAAAPWWRPIMANEPGVLDLPADRGRPVIPSHRGQLVQRTVPSSMKALLWQHCSTSGTTLFSTLLAGLEVFLMYYTGRRRFAIGTMTAGRNQPDLHPLVGLFADMTVVPADLRDSPSFTELGHRVQAQVARAVDQPTVPFSELVTALNRRDDLTRVPLLQVRYQHREAGEETWCFNGLSTEVGELDSGLTKSDLALYSADYGDQLVLMLGYACDLFDASTAHRLLTDYECLLETMLASPEMPIDRIYGLAAPPGGRESSEIRTKVSGKTP